MDQDSIRVAAQELIKYQPLTIDWEVIIWALGIPMLIIVGLLGWIGTMIRNERGTFISIQTKHEEWILENQKDIKELAIETREAIMQNKTSIDFIKDYLIKKK